MKVLLRENYKWVDAKLDTRYNLILDMGGHEIQPAQIVSVENHDRKKYVKCKGCGKIIRKNAKTIAEHQSRSSTSATCLNCDHMSQRSSVVSGKRYLLNDDGSYTVSTKVKCQLVCNYSYYRDINSEESRTRCKYVRCATSGVEPLKDVFTEYPAVFDTIATVDALDKKKWRYATRNIYDGRLIYNLRKRGLNLSVHVHNGIIDHFVYKTNGYVMSFVYSAKYHKIFWVQDRKYRTDGPYIFNEVKDDLLNICKEIYKGVR